MSVDREYSIKIATVADGSGARQAADDLKSVGTAATTAGEEGEHAAKGLFESHHELHKLLHTIGEDAIPGMGRAFGALAMGPLGAVVAVGAAIEFLKRQIEETNKKLDEMSATAGKTFGGNDWITDYVNAVSQAVTETENLEKALHNASDAGPEIKTQYDVEAAAIRNVAAALEERLKAEGKAELIHAAAEEALTASRARELAERQSNKPSLEQAARSLETPVGTIQERQARGDELQAQEAALAKATSELNTAQNDELKEQVEKKKELLELSRKDHPEWAGKDPFGFVKQMQDEADRLESETAEARAERARERIKQLSGQVISDTKNAAREKEAVADAAALAVENDKRIVELERLQAASKFAADTKKQSTDALIQQMAGQSGDPDSLRHLAGVDSAPGIEAFRQRFADAQSRLQQHRGTAADSDTIRLMNQVLESSRSGDQLTNQLLKELIQSHGQHTQNINKLFALFQQVQSRNDRQHQ